MASVYWTGFDKAPQIQVGVLLVSGLGLLITKVLDAVYRQAVLCKIILTAFIAIQIPLTSYVGLIVLPGSTTVVIVSWSSCKGCTEGTLQCSYSKVSYHAMQ